MEYYDEFLKFHTPDVGSIKNIDHGLVRKYSNSVTPGLIELWQEVGLCSFHDGLFWLVNPEAWSKSLEEFGIENGIPILRGSFGSIVYINHSGEVRQLTSILCRDIRVIDNLDFYFAGMLSGKDYYKDAFIERLHRKAVKRLGKIESDECYGFEPLLSLGGQESLENLSVVKVVEHLALIAQTV